MLLNPSRERDAGTYQCFATNSLGTVVSREARLQFACKFWLSHVWVQHLAVHSRVGTWVQEQHRISLV